MNKEYIKKFCEEFNYPKEAVKALYDASDYVEKNKTLCNMFEKFLNEYNADIVTDPAEIYGEMTKYAREQNNFHYETIDLLFYVLMAEHLEEVYKRNGLSRDLWHNAMNDLRYKLIECHNCKGIWGTFVGGWFPEFYSLKRVALGRIQYQPSNFSQDYITLDGKYNVKKGDLFIDMHIPSSGKLKIEDVKDSINQATEYFGSMFDDKDYVLFGCESWMLFDKHREMLPETSGIIQFMNLFSYCYIEENPSNDLWRIFNSFETSHADLYKLPEDTLLRKKYKEYLMAGGKQGCGFGIFKNLKRQGD